MSATGVGSALLILHLSTLLSSSYTGSGIGLPTFPLDQGSAGSGLSAHVEWPLVVAHRSRSTSIQAGQGALASLPGLGLVPPKRVKRIQGKEYVDIGGRRSAVDCEAISGKCKIAIGQKCKQLHKTCRAVCQQ